MNEKPDAKVTANIFMHKLLCTFCFVSASSKEVSSNNSTTQFQRCLSTVTPRQKYPSYDLFRSFSTATDCSGLQNDFGAVGGSFAFCNLVLTSKAYPK